MSRKDKDRIIFAGRCVEVDDPLILGRIRVIPTSENEQEIYSAIPDDCAEYDPTNKSKKIEVKQECRWKSGDPFLFLPLLPFSISIQPQIGEYVHVIYGDKSFKYQNQFYIPGVYSSPMAINYENFNASQTFLASGSRIDETLFLKDELNQYRDEKSRGIFPEPKDNALVGRGSADVIVKEDEVLLRAGKYIGKLNPNVFPVANNRRSFLQLTNFNQKKVDNPETDILNLTKQVKVVKKLIEWNIFNPENNSDPRAFTGVINLYNVLPNISTNTDNFSVDSDVSNFISAPIYQVPFFSETFENVVSKINLFIQGVNNGKIIIPTPPVDVDPSPNVIISDAPDSFEVTGDIFPFVFRPSPLTYQYIINFDGTNNSIQYNNILKFNEVIKLNPSDKESGFGKVYNRDKTEPEYDVKTTKASSSSYVDAPITYAALGGDKVYLLSHSSDKIPGTKGINLSQTIYGIDQPRFTDNLTDNTNSMVRGEQLLNFLNLITKFLVAHVHPYPGLPPVPVAVDGTQSAKILSELLNAPNTILNQNIRIN
jgi:hypothetical protein